MHHRSISRFGIIALATLITLITLTACGTRKQAKVDVPPAPQPPAAPTATLSAAPGAIEQGQSAQLAWQTTNATDITLVGIGSVNAMGSRAVTPNGSQTYTLVAKGPGGMQEASARVTVNPAAARATAPAPAQEAPIADVFFDYDKFLLRADALPAMKDDAVFLARHPEMQVLIEGHCDDRGSEEYNLALGVSRATAVKRALQEQGIDASRIKTISYGKERPFCGLENEQCWQENRRDHIVAQK